MGKLRMAVGTLLTFPLLLLSLFYALLPTSLLRLFGAGRAADAWIRKTAAFTSNYLLWAFGVKVHVSGEENFPRDAKRVCYVSNHQSNLDIPVLFGRGNVFAGVIAKDSLRHVPILNWWAKEMRCIYLVRKSVRSSIQAILSGVNLVKAGNPVLVFPEGTRSRTGEVGTFKAGSFALATRSGATIVPLAITGTRSSFEERKKWRTDVHLAFCKPVDTSRMTSEEKKAVPALVEEKVRREFDALSAIHA